MSSWTIVILVLIAWFVLTQNSAAQPVMSVGTFGGPVPPPPVTTPNDITPPPPEGPPPPPMPPWNPARTDVQVVSRSGVGHFAGGTVTGIARSGVGHF